MPYAVIDSAIEIDASILAWMFDSEPPPPAAGLVVVLDVAAVLGSTVVVSLAEPPPPPPAAGLVVVLDVAAVLGSTVVVSLAEPPPPPPAAGLVVVIDVAAVVGSMVRVLLAEPPPPPPPGSHTLVCAVGATRLMMRGEDRFFSGGNLFIGTGGRWVVASVAGKRMKFRSEETAESWAELVILRAASEIGLASALPAASREKWKAKKYETLTAYQNRLVETAARLLAGSEGQAALLDEIAIVQDKLDSL